MRNLKPQIGFLLAPKRFAFPIHQQYIHNFTPYIMRNTITATRTCFTRILEYGLFNDLLSLFLEMGKSVHVATDNSPDGCLVPRSAHQPNVTTSTVLTCCPIVPKDP